MTFGGCYLRSDSSVENMTLKSVKIEGKQQGLLINFEVTQVFSHSKPESQEITYIFPNDMKICIYDLTFVLGEQIIKPKIKAKEEAEKIYDEAVKQGKTAVYGSNVRNGMSEFKIGNLPPEIECKVILKVAFISQITKSNSFFIKFPFDVYTPSGSKHCLDYKASEFNFQLQCDSEKVTKVTSNVKNYNFDANTKIFSIHNKIENKLNENSIIITFETKDRLSNSLLIDKNSQSNYENCLLTLSPIVPPTDKRNTEFVFLVDCSYSMEGTSIEKASECLEVFVRSLPLQSRYNIIKFGSDYEKLFKEPVEYNEETMQKGLDLISKLEADLGGTELYNPLHDLFNIECKYGQRQIFIITDGEIWDKEKLLKLISAHSDNNRCFAIGIGRGCDAGLVEGIARTSGGKCDYVQEGDSISEKIIPQLEGSLLPYIESIEIHIEGNETFEISPFPIPNLSVNGSETIFIHSNKKNGEISSKGILVTASFGEKPLEFVVDEINEAETLKEDKFGCSNGKNVAKSIFPLFVFTYMQKLNLKESIDDAEKAKIIDLSIQSGVLSEFTGYVGIVEAKEEEEEYECDECDECEFDGGLFDCCCSSSKRKSKKTLNFINDDDDDENREEEEVEMAGGFDDLFDFGSNYRSYKEEAIECCECREEEEVEMAGGFDDLFDGGPSVSHNRKDSSDDDDDENDKNKKVDLSFSLLNLIKLQKFDGSWDDLQKINKMIGLNVQNIDGVSLENKELEKKCLATVIAIAALHAKFMDEKNTWSMIERKAITWLKSNLPNVDVEKIIGQTENLINA